MPTSKSSFYSRQHDVPQGGRSWRVDKDLADGWPAPPGEEGVSAGQESEAA